MSRPVPFDLLDVFTDTPFGGNQLAVVRLPAAVSDALMQQVAAEFNLSETVFVLPDGGDADFRLRIFTPRFELPFAGHPTIGAAVLLGPAVGGTVRLRENVGVINVSVEGGFATLTVTQAPEFRPAGIDRAGVAAVLGLRSEDLAADPVAASAGVPFLLVMLRDEAALNRAECDQARWQAALAHQWAPHLLLWCDGGPEAVSARMFAPAMGIREDPATGAAAAALGAWLGTASPERDHERRLTISQGVKMGRPSAISVSWLKRAGSVTEIRVGGRALRIASGMLELPETAGPAAW